MCISDRHDMTLAVKVTLNPNTTNQPVKAFVDDKINVTIKLKFVSESIENILGKGKNAGYQHFFLFPKCFQKPPSLGLLKSVLFGKQLSA